MNEFKKKFFKFIKMQMRSEFDLLIKYNSLMFMFKRYE